MKITRNSKPSLILLLLVTVVLAGCGTKYELNSPPNPMVLTIEEEEKMKQCFGDNFYIEFTNQQARLWLLKKQF
jgi:predicted small lipoprotein YifL